LAHITYTIHGEHSDRQRLKDIIRGELDAFFHTGEVSQSETDARHGELVRCALRLDLYIISTQYNVKLGLHDPKTGKAHGFAFDPETMESQNDTMLHPWKEIQDDKTMEIVWKPRISVYGVSDGCLVDDSRVTQREYCNWSEKFVVGCDMYEVVDSGYTRGEWLAMLQIQRAEWLASQEGRVKMGSSSSKGDDAEPSKAEGTEPLKGVGLLKNIYDNEKVEWEETVVAENDDASSKRHVCVHCSPLPFYPLFVFV
jgi:hypothetical protein